MLSSSLELEDSSVIKVMALNIYPVKSLQGISVQQAELGERGLAYDRHWMIVDQAGQCVTQRNLPLMAQIEIELTSSELVLKHPSKASISVDLNVGHQKVYPVQVWDDQCLGLDEGDDVSAWLTSVIGQWEDSELRLVRFSDDDIRPVEPDFLQGEDAHTAFSDAYPFLITNEASLILLNNHLTKKGSQTIGMDRFRPNIVIAGIEAFEEDQVDTLSAPNDGYQLALRKPCERCKVTTIDQRSGFIAEAKEPLATLVKMKTQPDLKGAFFGQNALLIKGQKQLIKVGDELALVLK